MYEDILDELVEYSKAFKMIDPKFMRDIVDIVSKEKKLEKFVKVINLDNIGEYQSNNIDDDDCILGYQFFAKSIIVDVKRVKALYEEHMSVDFTDNYFDKVFFANARIIELVLHELEHANQYKKSLHPNNCFENKLLGICFGVENEYLKHNFIDRYLINYRSCFLDKNYEKRLKLVYELEQQYEETSPFERLAYIKGLRGCQKIVDAYDGDTTFISRYNKMTLADYFLSGYDFSEYYSAPTKRYLLDYSKLDVGYNRDYLYDFVNCDLGKEEVGFLKHRLTYGLSINEKEYQKVKKISNGEF